MNSIARGKFGFIVRMARAAGRRGNCFTMPDSGKSRMSQVESMRGAEILTPRRPGTEVAVAGPATVLDFPSVARRATATFAAKPGTQALPDIDVEEKLKEAFSRGW